VWRFEKCVLQKITKLLSNVESMLHQSELPNGMKITIKIKIKIVHPIIAKKSVQRPIKTFL